ncbi:hypothetical protein WJX74_010499 [Apatococcus lobatus]|uniref:Uncharacterized protein n=1 Tax=Apatococcus lobatus TaxID=904363 RepID=A0AAW1R1N1_9CHLO
MQRPLSLTAKCGCQHSAVCSSWKATRSISSSTAPKRQRGRHSTQAVLDHDTGLAVIQQSVSFIPFILGEAYVSRSTLPKDRPGRPGLIPVAASCVSYAAACALLNFGEATTKAGLILGWATSLAMLAYYFKRALDTKGSASDWPGPKVWPGTQALISFFCLNIYFQAFLKS